MAGICILLSVFFISCLSFGNQDLLNRFIEDCIKKQSAMIVVEIGTIKLWDPKLNTTKSLFEKDEYKYIASNESILSPSLCFGNKKILYAKNIIGENIGKLIFLNLLEKKEKLIFENRAMWSPALSADNKKIAYLSDYKKDNLFALFVCEINAQKITKIIGNVYGGGYNYNLSWSPDSTAIAYSDADGFLNVIDINTKEIKKLIKGYNPLFSPDGKQILFSNSQYKPYKPLIYDLASGQTQNLKAGSDVYNAIWSPDGKYLIVVKKHTSLKDMLSFNEWGRKVVVYDIAKKEKADLFKYEGFEYIDLR